MEEFKTRVEQVLQTPLNIDSPVSLQQDVSVIESLSYLPVKFQSYYENKIAAASDALRKKRAEASTGLRGTVAEKNMMVDSITSELSKAIDEANAELHYWKNISRLIENKTSLAQSVLTSIGNQIKAGIWANGK